MSSALPNVDTAKLKHRGFEEARLMANIAPTSVHSSNSTVASNQTLWTAADMEASHRRQLAGVMASSPNLAIFKRFGSLAMLNLMRLQGDLKNLEGKLEGRITTNKTHDQNLLESRGLLNEYCIYFLLRLYLPN
jgi:hypothetical protein